MLINPTLRKSLLRSSYASMMTNLFIEIIILFILLLFYFSVANSHDNNNWLRALVLAVAIPTLGLIPNYIGIVGWLIAIVIALVLISKVLGQSFAGSFLFLMIVGLAQYIIQLGIHKFI